MRFIFLPILALCLLLSNEVHAQLNLALEDSIIRQAFGGQNKSITLKDVENTVSIINAAQRGSVLSSYLSLDVDGDGVLSKSELGAHKKLTRQPQIQALMEHEPPINVATMIKAANAAILQTGLSFDAKAIFKQFDKDANGTITLQEYKGEKPDALAIRQPSGEPMTQEEMTELAKLDIARVIVSRAGGGATLPYTAGKLELEAFINGAKEKIAVDRMAHLRNILAFDINGDGGLSQAERDRVPTARALNNFPVIQEMSETKGNYSYADLSAAADRLVIKKNEHLSDLDTLYAMMDWDQNGTIYPKDLKEVERRRHELRTKQHYHNAGKTAPAKPNCELPTPSKKAEVVMLGTYEGRALSKISLGQTGRDTSTARINIEKGNAPLYIVAGSYDALVWALSGATKRVEKFVIQGEKSGVAGLPKDRVHFGTTKCIKYFYNTKKIRKDNKQLVSLSKNLGGAKIDHIVGGYGIAEISIPSGKFPKPKQAPLGTYVSLGQGKSDYIITPDGPVYLKNDKDFDKLSGSGRPDNVSSEFWFNYTRFHPNTAMAEIDIKDVVSQRKPQYLDVLPQWHGLLQLINEGKIKEVKGKRSTFRVLKPLEAVPSGLAGGYSVTFVVPDGISVPTSGYSHSKVIYEEDGRCVGATCPR